MTTVYILAHFDDEYCALPLLLQGRAEGVDQHFLYVSDYAEERTSVQRQTETCNFLAAWGLDPGLVDHVARGTGVMDGGVHHGLDRMHATLADRLSRIPRIDRIVTPAWEGGHVDHDMCALLAATLAAEFDVPIVQQFSLYNGKGLIGPMFNAARPLSENGPIERVPMPWRDSLRWIAGVSHFTSQAKTWLGLGPVMFATLALRGFGVQRLDPERLAARPHAGPLLYERMYGTSYADVRAAADAFLRERRGDDSVGVPARTDRQAWEPAGARTANPAKIST